MRKTKREKQTHSTRVTHLKMPGFQKIATNRAYKDSLLEFDQELHDRCTREAGYEEGLADGAKETAIANAKNLYENGVAIDIIAKSLGMSLEEVKEITQDITVKA